MFLSYDELEVNNTLERREEFFIYFPSLRPCVHTRANSSLGEGSDLDEENGIGEKLTPVQCAVSLPPPHPHGCFEMKLKMAGDLIRDLWHLVELYVWCGL